MMTLYMLNGCKQLETVSHSLASGKYFESRELSIKKVYKERTKLSYPLELNLYLLPAAGICV